MFSVLLFPFLFVYSFSEPLPCQVYETTNYFLTSNSDVESYERFDFQRIHDYVNNLQKLSEWSLLMFPKPDSVTAQVTISDYPMYQNFVQDKPDFTLPSTCTNHFILFRENTTVCGSTQGHLVFDLHCHHYFKIIANTVTKTPIALSFFKPGNHMDLLYMLTTKSDLSLAFVDFNDSARKCVSHPSPLVLNTVRDIFSTARALFKYLEKFLFTYFSDNNCYSHSVNFSPMKLTPSLLERLQMILDDHPFSAALLLSRPFLSRDIVCYRLTHDSKSLIAVNAAQILALFNIMEIFDLHQSSEPRSKRSFFDLIEYSFNGGKEKIERVVAQEFADRIQITKLEEIQRETSFNLDTLFSDIHILEDRDMISKLEIHRLHLTLPFLKHLNSINNVFRDFQIILNNMESTLQNQYNLILQELTSYSHLVTNCIMQQSTCHFDTTSHYCRDKCFLHSTQADLTIHYTKQLYKRQSLSHITCFHSSLGEIFNFGRTMFIKNETHFTDISNKRLAFPSLCLLGNNDLCRTIWTISDNTPYIMQCINNEVFITGRTYYVTHLQNNISLTFTPTKIDDEKFPIKLTDVVFYKQDICKSPLRSFHKTFAAFQKNRDSFSYQLFGPSFMDHGFDTIIQSSSLNSSTFKTHLQTVLNKIKQLDINEIHGRFTSLSFIFTIIFVFIIILLLATLCCCPTIFFSLCKCVISKISSLSQHFLIFLYQNFRILFRFLYRKLHSYILVHREESPVSPASAATGPVELGPPPAYSSSGPQSRPLFSSMT